LPRKTSLHQFKGAAIIAAGEYRKLTHSNRKPCNNIANILGHSPFKPKQLAVPKPNFGNEKYLSAARVAQPNAGTEKHKQGSELFCRYV